MSLTILVVDDEENARQNLTQFLTSKEYEVIGVARHSETLEPMVVYRPLDRASGWWVRPHAMFFERVLVDGVAQLRFTPIAAAD